MLFHTHEVTREILQEAVATHRSMDLDVCVDPSSRAYLGHSPEYYDASDEHPGDPMPLWEAVDLIAASDIPVIVDCKHRDAWRHVEKVVAAIGPERCLVYSFVSELNMAYAPHPLSVECEWSPIARLADLKMTLPGVSVTAGAKGLPEDILLPGRHPTLLRDIRQTLIDNDIDTVCFNVPDKTMNDWALRHFLDAGIVPHVMVDDIDVDQLALPYIGETDVLARTTSVAA